MDRSPPETARVGLPVLEGPKVVTLNPAGWSLHVVDTRSQARKIAECDARSDPPRGYADQGHGNGGSAREHSLCPYRPTSSQGTETAFQGQLDHRRRCTEQTSVPRDWARYRRGCEEAVLTGDYSPHRVPGAIHQGRTWANPLVSRAAGDRRAGHGAEAHSAPRGASVRPDSVPLRGAWSDSLVGADAVTRRRWADRAQCPDAGRVALAGCPGAREQVRRQERG